MTELYNQSRSFNLGVATETSIEAALLFDELSFWSSRTKRPDGWFYKTYADFLERIPLMSERSMRTHLGTLIRAGYIKKRVMKAEGSPVTHYKICRSLSAKVAETIETAKVAETINKENSNYTATKDKDVESIYQIYLEAFGKNPNLYRLTDQRRTKIKARIKDAGRAMTEEAVRRTAASKFHRGANDRDWHADLDWIVHNYERVEKLSQLKRDRGGVDDW